MKAPVISVVIPVYNEEQSLRETYERITEVMRAASVSFELVFVNDGSTDASPDVLEGICARDARCSAIFLARNFGHQAAITAGMMSARGQAVVVIDADLQDPPEVIPEMIARWKAGAEVVYGRRSRRRGEGPFKRITAALFYRLVGFLSDVPLPRDVGDFRLVDRAVCDQLNRLREKHRYMRGLVGWLGYRQETVDYIRQPRRAGVTKYPLGKMVAFALDAVTSFSNRPLRIASYLGFLVALGGFSYLVVIAIRKLAWNATVEGWASLMSVIIVFNGLMLLFLGLLGEYLGRIYDEVKDRPLFVVSKTLVGRRDRRPRRKDRAHER